MAAVLGLNAKLYIGSGTWASPTWAEIDTAREVTINLEAAEADATIRGGGGWRETVAGLKDATLEFEMRYDPGDSSFSSLQSAFMATPSTMVPLLALDGDVTTTGSHGFRGEYFITGFSRNEPLEEILTVSVTAKVKSSDNPPEWYTAS